MRPEPLPTALPESAGFDPVRSRNIVNVLQGEVNRGRLPGAVAMVARHGQVLLHEAVGHQDPQAGTPMAVDSIFRI